MPSGTCVMASCSRIPAKIIKASANPIAVEIAYTTDSNKIILFLDYKDSHTQDTAVRGDQRKEYAQRLIKGGRDLLQYDFHHLNQGGDDQDETDRLHEP